MEKVTFITTVKNDEEGVRMLFDSLLQQKKLPDEVVVVDAKSNDETPVLLERYKKAFEEKKVDFIVKSARCNRARGRNIAIQQAKHEVIVVSDAGCALAKDWLQNITKPFEASTNDVVSGYYITGAGNVFQKCMAAYTSVMPDKLNQQYIPSSRSIAFRKKKWRKVKGYPEYLDTCEDLVFARNLKKAGAEFFLEKKALVTWPQVTTFSAAAKQFFGYARGDGQARYMRPQTPFLFGRYAVAIGLFLLGFAAPMFWTHLLIAAAVYTIWAAAKNYRYVRDPHALYILPLLQYLSDIAVMSGMCVGYLDRAPIAKAMLWQVLGKMISTLIGVMTFSLLARSLQPLDMSAYAYITSFVVLLLTFADGGIDTLVTREAHKKNNDVPYLLAVRLLLCMIIIVVSIVIGGIFIVAAIGQSLVMLINAMVSFYKGTKNFKKAVIFNILFSTLLFLATLLAVTIQPTSHSVIATTALFTFFAFLWLKRDFTIQLFPLKKVVATAFSILPFGLASIVSVAYLKLDVLFLGHFYSPHLFPDVGIYAMAYRPFELMIVFGGLYTQTLLPYMVGVVAQRRFIMATFLKSVGVAVFLGACTFFGASFIIDILGGSDYAASVYPLRILAVAVVTTIIAGYAFTLVVAQRRENLVLIASLITLFVNIGMNFLLIPKYSYIGASWATAITQATLCGTALIAAYISLQTKKKLHAAT